jgi:hypothetical protein
MFFLFLASQAVSHHCGLPSFWMQRIELGKFNSQLSAFLSTVLQKANTTHILGANTNSSIGTRNSLVTTDSLPSKHERNFDINPALNLLGPFGNPTISKAGEAVLNLMQEHKLRAASTFFDNNQKYNMCLGLPNAIMKKRQAYQLDHIFIPKLQLCHTTNVKRGFDGAPSDHAALHH